MPTCPKCLQPYLRISNLINPFRTIYVHRETKGAAKNPVDFCMGSQAAPTQVVDGVASKLNSKKFEKQVASHQIGVVKSNQTQQSHNIQNSPKGQENNKMAFIGFDVAKLTEQFPSKGIGRSGGAPSIAISDKGRLTFSSAVAKVFEGCTVAMPAKDKDNPLRVQLAGFSEKPKGKENMCWDVVRSKETKRDGSPAKTHQTSVNFPLILKALNYDYAKAGNQTYTVEKLDAEKHSVTFLLPATLPTPKPKQERKPRVAKVAAVVAATVPAVATAVATSDDEVVVE